MRPRSLLPLCLALALARGTPGRAQLAVTCEPAPGGLRSLVVELDGGRVEARETDEAILIEASDPGDDLEGGPLRCPPARAVQVVPGRVLGTDRARVLVALGDERPRVVSGPGRVRLLWLPRGLAEGGAEPAPSAPVAEAADAGARPERSAPEAAESPEPVPARDAEWRPSAPTPRPPLATATGLPADFLELERPVEVVAILDTERRLGPGRRFPAAGGVAIGARVVASGRAGDWLRTDQGDWVFGPYFEAPGEALAAGGFAARVTAINAAVHSGPAAQHEIVAEIYRGDRVVIDEVKDEWAHVRDGGWVRLSEIARIEVGKD